MQISSRFSTIPRSLTFRSPSFTGGRNLPYGQVQVDAIDAAAAAAAGVSINAKPTSGAHQPHARLQYTDEHNNCFQRLRESRAPSFIEEGMEEEEQ